MVGSAQKMGLWHSLQLVLCFNHLMSHVSSLEVKRPVSYSRQARIGMGILTMTTLLRPRKRLLKSLRPVSPEAPGLGRFSYSIMQRPIKPGLPMPFLLGGCQKARNIRKTHRVFQSAMPLLRMVSLNNSITQMASSRACRLYSVSAVFGLPSPFEQSARTSNAQIRAHLHPPAVPAAFSSINQTLKIRRASFKNSSRVGGITSYSIRSFIVKLISLRCAGVVPSMCTECTISRETNRNRREIFARHWIPYPFSRYNGKHCIPPMSSYYSTHPAIPSLVLQTGQRASLMLTNKDFQGARLCGQTKNTIVIAHCLQP